MKEAIRIFDLTKFPKGICRIFLIQPQLSELPYCQIEYEYAAVRRLHCEILELTSFSSRFRDKLAYINSNHCRLISVRRKLVKTLYVGFIDYNSIITNNNCATHN